jgi:hypothetical protein
MQILHHGSGASAGFDWFDVVVGLLVLGAIALVGWAIYRFATRAR